MANNSIKKNYAYNLTYNILTILSPIITTPYLSRILGADGVGTYSYYFSIVSYFVMASTLGISIYGQREISYVRDDVIKRTEVFWNTKALSLISSAICLLLYLLGAGFSSEENRILYYILSISILNVTCDVTWFFAGLEDFKTIALRNIIFKLLTIVGIFVFVRHKENLIIYALILLGLEFVGNISLWIGLHKYIGRIAFSKLKPFSCLETVLSLFAPTIAIQVYTVLDKTMIGLYSDSSFQNGYYEQAMKISKLVLSIVTTLGTVIIPRIGYYYENKNYDELKRLMYKSYRFVWFLSIPLCLGLIGVSDNFVPWFFGEDFLEVSYLLKILSILIVAIGISNVTGIQYLVPTKQNNVLTMTVILGAVINFSLNLLVIPHYFAKGAAFTSVIAEIVIAVAQLIYVRKELEVAKIVKPVYKYLLAGIIMLCALMIEDRYLNSSILNTALMVTSGVMVYILMLLVLKDEFLLSMLKIKKGIVE